MKHFILYNSSNNQILASGTCREEDLHYYAREGYALIDGAGSGSTGYISNGEFIPYTLEQRLAKSNQPSMTSIWSDETFSWIETRSDEEIANTLTQNSIVSAKNKRNKLLAECDWVVTKSLEQGNSVSDSWKEYRQELRDITQQAGFPNNINWPNKPT